MMCPSEGFEVGVVNLDTQIEAARQHARKMADSDAKIGQAQINLQDAAEQLKLVARAPAAAFKVCFGSTALDEMDSDDQRNLHLTTLKFDEDAGILIKAAVLKSLEAEVMHRQRELLEQIIHFQQRSK